MDWTGFLAAHIPEPATITVEARTGSAGLGDTYAAPATVTGCVIEETTRRVTVSGGDQQGKVVVSTVTVYAPPTITAPPGSRVTLPSGAVVEVLATSLLDSYGHPLPEHRELALG